jgi:hypothetical protein
MSEIRMANKTNSTTASKKARGGLTKMEAVRRALAELGRDAKPLKIQAWVKDTYGTVMSADHVSTYKGTILRKARGRRKSAARKSAALPQPSAAREVRSAARGDSFSLEDIEALKSLVGRVGADGLKRLIDVLGR